MAERMTPAELDAAEALANAATEGPWRLGVSGWDGDRVDEITSPSQTIIMAQDERGGASWWSDEDAEFIAAARELVPRLVAEVRALRAEVESYQRLFTRHDTSNQKHYDEALEERIEESRRADAAEAEVRARDTVIEAVRAIHQESRWDTPLGRMVPGCRVCRSHGPCATIRALEGAIDGD